MEALSPTAAAISTYGPDAIIAILCLVVAYLYKRVTLLEKEMRDQLLKFQQEMSTREEQRIKDEREHEEKRRAELITLISTSNAVTERNTEALNDIRAWFRSVGVPVSRQPGMTIPP